MLPPGQGPTHHLEITPLPDPEPSPGVLRLEDLSTDEEEVLHGRISQYEKKIDSLMTEVSSLKSEVGALLDVPLHSGIESPLALYLLILHGIELIDKTEMYTF